MSDRSRRPLISSYNGSMIALTIRSGRCFKVYTSELESYFVAVAKLRTRSANISLDIPGNLDWKVDVQESIIDKSTQYRFRLMEHTNPAVYTLKNPRLPSRGFYLFPIPAASASSSAISTTATPSTSTSPSPSATAKPASEKSPKNIGAIAGGVVAGLVGLALLCGIALLLLRRIGQKRKAKANEEGPLVYDSKAREYPPVELHGNIASELDGSKQPNGTVTELQGSTPRNLH